MVIMMGLRKERRPDPATHRAKRSSSGLIGILTIPEKLKFNNRNPNQTSPAGKSNLADENRQFGIIFAI